MSSTPPHGTGEDILPFFGEEVASYVLFGRIFDYRKLKDVVLQKSMYSSRRKYLHGNLVRLW